jgi:peptidoglycan/LPS O-acetylase OafA/YrhL
LLTFGVGSGALLLALLNTKVLGKGILGRGLVRLGDASYTLYLSHLIFIDAFHELGFFALLGQKSAPLANLGAITFVIAVCLFSIAFYRLYEKPSYLWLKRRS